MTPVRGWLLDLTREGYVFPVYKPIHKFDSMEICLGLIQVYVNGSKEVLDLRSKRSLFEAFCFVLEQDFLQHSSVPV